MGNAGYQHYHGLQIAVGGTNVGGSLYAGHVIGGTIIAEYINTTPDSMPVDEFITATVTYTPDPADAGLAGQPLQIRLLAVEDPTDHSITGYVDFDDVKLSRSSGELSTVDLDLYEDMVINFSRRLMRNAG